MYYREKQVHACNVAKVMKNINQTELTFQEAKIISEKQQTRNAIRFEEYMEEIKTSNPLALTASDFEFYAGQLNHYNPDKKKKYTSNDVRRMMMEGKGIDAFDVMQSFIDAEDDSIIDFY